MTAQRYTDAAAKRTADRQAEALRQMGVCSDGQRVAPPRDPKHDDVRDRIILWLIEEGCECFPTYTGPIPFGRRFAGRSGTPDVLGWQVLELPVCEKGDIHALYRAPFPRFFALDVKMPGDTLSKEQKAILDKLNAAGGIGMEVRYVPPPPGAPDPLAPTLEAFKTEWKERTNA